MNYKQTTQVPNAYFDSYLKDFNLAEMKVFSIILRQTYGWADRRTGKRKSRDRITNKWFMKATGLSKRAISKALCSLSFRKLIVISDYHGKALCEGKERQGKTYLYYSITPPAHETPPTNARNAPEPAHETYHNKTNSLKTKNVRKLSEGFRHISSFSSYNAG